MSLVLSATHDTRRPQKQSFTPLRAAATMELATVAAAVASAAARPHGPFSSPRAVSASVSWTSLSLASTSHCLSTSSRRRLRWLPVTSAAVELREATAGGGDSLRVTKTSQPGSSVSPRRLRPPLPCLALIFYGHLYVPFLRRLSSAWRCLLPSFTSATNPRYRSTPNVLRYHFLRKLAANTWTSTPI